MYYILKPYKRVEEQTKIQDQVYMHDTFKATFHPFELESFSFTVFAWILQFESRTNKIEV